MACSNSIESANRKEFIEKAAQEFGTQPKYRILTRPMITIAGWFDSNIRESYEMLYQYDLDFLFDSRKFEKAFNFEPTSYSEGIRITAAMYRKTLV